MLKKDATKFYGNSSIKVAKALNISKGAVSAWGRVIPFISAMRLHSISNGAIPLREDEDYHPITKRILKKQKPPRGAANTVARPSSFE